MAKQVKIVNFIDDREGREDAEERLSEMVTEGWEIKAAGGGNAAGLLWGFVILQKEGAAESKAAENAASEAASTQESASSVAAPNSNEPKATT
jgi:hypothetical protein